MEKLKGDNNTRRVKITCLEMCKKSWEQIFHCRFRSPGTGAGGLLGHLVRSLQDAGPVLEEIAGELAGRVKVVKVNVEESRELVGQFRIMSVPTLVLLKEGKELTRITGYLPKEELLDKLESFL